MPYLFLRVLSPMRPYQALVISAYLQIFTLQRDELWGLIYTKFSSHWGMDHFINWHFCNDYDTLYIHLETLLLQIVNNNILILYLDFIGWPAHWTEDNYLGGEASFWWKGILHPAVPLLYWRGKSNFSKTLAWFFCPLWPSPFYDLYICSSMDSVVQILALSRFLKELLCRSTNCCPSSAQVKR